MHHKVSVWLPVVLSSFILLSSTGCGGGFSNAPSLVTNTSTNTTSQIPSVQHVVIVVLENTNYSQVVGNPSMPYLNGLFAKGGLASNYYANLHPSIGNYMIMTTGLPYTVDDNFSGTVPIDNVVRELTNASKTWKSYAEDLPSVGYLGPDIPPFYLRRHVPLSYMTDVQPPSSLANNIVPFSQFSTDLAAGALPSYSFVSPNALHSAHTCSDGTTNCSINVRLSNADQWLSANIAPLVQDAKFQQSGLLVITFDESADDLTNGGGKVMTLILGTHVKAGYVGTGSYDHRSLLSLTMTALGVPIPNGAGAAAQMTEFFQ